MIVQIYGVMTPEDGAMVAGLGADHVGIVVGRERRTPDEVDFELARAIFAAIPPGTRRVALTVATDLDEIEAMARAVQPDILHLAAAHGDLPPQAVAQVRQRLPGLPLMQAISVDGPQAAETAVRYADVADYLLLDTHDPDLAAIGATGRVHDWSISRRIVEAVRIPTILAGGLGPENVAAAIQAVHPWGVDSQTHTNRSGQPIRKDPDKVRRFIAAARSRL